MAFILFVGQVVAGDHVVSGQVEWYQTDDDV